MIQIDLTKKYALAVSGGVDSMTMLHMFASLSPRPDFFVVTVNHNIRAQAQADCEFVANYCKQLNVDCHIVFVDVPLYAKERKLSEETAGRILRYKSFDGLDCDYVCLAHHAGDNAETVLMHILRGAGARGASGISAQNGKYLRPLLNITRDEIEQYAKQNGVPYVFDATNDDTKYSRNFVRRKVMPLLKQLNPNAERNIARFAENIAEDDGYLDSLADVSSVCFADNSARIPVKLLRQPRPIALRVVNKTFDKLGVSKDIERTHLDLVIGLSYGAGGRRINLPFGFTAFADYDYVTVCQATSPANEYFEIPFKKGVTATPVGKVEVIATPVNDALRVDYGKLPAECVFRTRRQGDSFTKFGGGTKPLKKYLIDKKIPQRERDSLLLVAKGSEVYVICGVEISDKVKVDDDSDVCYITVSKGNNQ